MKLNNNKERLACWQILTSQYSYREIETAISTLKPDTQSVIRWHYQEGVSLKDIVPMLGKTMTIVRNHQNLGIHKLWLHFQKQL